MFFFPVLGVFSQVYASGLRMDQTSLFLSTRELLTPATQGAMVTRERLCGKGEKCWALFVGDEQTISTMPIGKLCYSVEGKFVETIFAWMHRMLTLWSSQPLNRLAVFTSCAWVTTFRTLAGWLPKTWLYFTRRTRTRGYTATWIISGDQDLHNHINVWTATAWKPLECCLTLNSVRTKTDVNSVTGVHIW